MQGNLTSVLNIRPLDFLVVAEGSCTLSHRMKRLLSFLIVLSCVSLVAACGKKTPNELPPLATNTQSSAGLETFESVEAKAKAGDATAQFELGAMYHDGQGVTKDFAQARSWFEKSAKQDDARAQFNLGVMYYTGEGVKQNYKAAQDWFEKAAVQNNTRALFNLGVMYYRGEGVKQDFAEAMNNFTKAGSLGFAEAQFNLGVMFAKGEGTEVDVGQSYAWFEAARSFGNPRASEILKEIESELQPDQLKIVKKMGEDLKKEINARVAALVASGQPF